MSEEILKYLQNMYNTMVDEKNQKAEYMAAVGN